MVLDWIEVHKAMYGTAPSVEDIHRVRNAFIERAARLKSENLQPEALAAIAERERSEPSPDWMFFGYDLNDWEREQAASGEGIWPQLALNERARNAYNAIETHLVAELGRWPALLQEEELKYFERAQELWKEFREANATFAAREYKGGTIAPMIYWGEMFDRTQERLLELERNRKIRERH